MTSTCLNTADPLFMPITYNYVAPRGSAAPSWGIFIEVGEPEQPFSMWPTMDDFSMVASSDDCLGTTDYDCLARQGGVYDINLSKTELNFTTIAGWNGSLGPIYTPTDFYYHNDVLTVGSNDTETKAYGWAFTTDNGRLWSTGNWLGLGRNSSFVNAIVQAGGAPIHSWGLWPGSRSIDNPLDGGLVLGGYDDSRVGGSFESFDGIDRCPTCITIKDIQWVNESASISLFSGSNETILGSLDAWYDSLYLPQSMWETFGQVTGGNYSDYWALFTWPAGQTPNGTVRVTLENGYQSDIPADEIFTKPRNFDANGTYAVSDNSIELALIGNYSSYNISSDGYPPFGLPFLTMNYLVLDVEQNKYRLAPAIRQNSTSGSVSAQKLCAGLAPATTSSSSTSSTSATPTPSSTTAPAPGASTTAATPASSGGGGGTPVGAIVGGAVGGAGGLILIALLAFFLFRRHRKSTTKPETEIANSPAVAGAAGAAPPYSPHPLPVQQVQKQYHFQPPPPAHFPQQGYPPPHSPTGYAEGYPPQSDYSSSDPRHSAGSPTFAYPQNPAELPSLGYSAAPTADWGHEHPYNYNDAAWQPGRYQR